MHVQHFSMSSITVLIVSNKLHPQEGRDSVKLNDSSYYTKYFCLMTRAKKCHSIIPKVYLSYINHS